VNLHRRSVRTLPGGWLRSGHRATSLPELLMVGATISPTGAISVTSGNIVVWHLAATFVSQPEITLKLERVSAVQRSGNASRDSALLRAFRSEIVDLVPRRKKNLRRPVRVVISGIPVDLVTIGYLANVFGRTTTTIRSWEGVLIPEAPFRLWPSIPNANRRLWPKAFVQALTNHDFSYLGTRLDPRDQDRFREEVAGAFNESMAPLRRSQGC